MKGFFTDKEYGVLKKRVKSNKSASPSSGKTTTLKVHSSLQGCEGCGLDKTCLSPKMKYSGEGQKNILIIAEAPGKTEDEKGIQLIGEAGQLLRNNLKTLGYDLDRDFWKTNSIICRPPNNRKPTKKELKCCKPNLDKVIEEIKPKFIWLMGSSALDTFFSGRFSEMSISTWRGKVIPYNGSWLIPMFHPSFVLRNNNEETKQFFVNDLKQALDKLSLPTAEPFSYQDKIKVLLESKDIIELLERVIESKSTIAFDYETNAISPNREKPVVLSISLCYNENQAFSFPVKDERVTRLWRRVLSNKDIPKLAHNLKFEDKWSRVFFKTIPQGWVWDTMVTQHVLDCQPGTAGLKFQSFVRWGVLDYESSVSKYISSGENGENRLHELDLNTLCFYNAVDSLLTLKLYNEQNAELRRNRFLQKGSNFFLQGTKAFCDIESNGICIDREFYQNKEKELTDTINTLTDELMNSNEAKLFFKQTNEQIKLGSSKDLRYLLFNILGIKSTKSTTKGAESVDKEALEEIDNPFTNKLTEIRKLLKIRDTYLAQFKRNDFNNKINPSFNLHLVKTYRSSSSDPNFQNIPVRDKLAKEATRGGIIPSPGNRLIEVDYAAIEVRIAACFTQDPELIQYIYDPTTDMHYDQAKLIFIADEKQMTKEMRFYTKNCFVFPEFYGSWYKNCASNLWEAAKNLKTVSDIPLPKHLYSQGVKNYIQFEDHIKKIENQFWKKFSVFKEWQEKALKNYLKNFYVDMFFGFKRTGLLSRNEIINSPIQGTAFHCLLWSLIRLNEISKSEGWETKIIGQIHDSILLDVAPEEEQYILETVKRVMTIEVREENPFLIVPLEVEVEATSINESWNKKEKLK